MKRSAYYSESLFDASLPLEQQPSDRTSSGLTQWLRSLWETVMEQLFSFKDNVQVWHTCDADGHIWWSAFDPATARSIQGVPETELRIWLENRYSFSSQQ